MEFGSLPHNPSSSSLSLSASSAVPDTDRLSLDGILSAEVASIPGVLGNFHLSDHFTQASTITGTILAGDSDLLCALSLILEKNKNKTKEAPSC